MARVEVIAGVGGSMQVTIDGGPPLAADPVTVADWLDAVDPEWLKGQVLAGSLDVDPIAATLQALQALARQP